MPFYITPVEENKREKIKKVEFTEMNRCLSRSYLSLRHVEDAQTNGKIVRDRLVCKIRYLHGDTRDPCFIFMRGVLAYSKHKLLAAG